MNKTGIFQIGNSVEFAVQVPDKSVGCSGSRCSHCNAEMAYCEHRCKSCGLPVIGPFGFPQIEEWSSLSAQKKRKIMETVYSDWPSRGRLNVINATDLLLVSLPWREIEGD